MFGSFVASATVCRHGIDRPVSTLNVKGRKRPRESLIVLNSVCFESKAAFSVAPSVATVLLSAHLERRHGSARTLNETLTRQI